MSARAAALVVALIAAAAASVASRRALAVTDLAALPADAARAADDVFFDLTGYRFMSGWLEAATKPEHAANVAAMRAAEDRYSIPRNLVVRLAWQESRFDPQASNPSGASGIMQIVPRWHPGVDPLNPLAAIDYGARFLSQLYRQFGTWELALKAYNWGPGNVQKWLDSARQSFEPLETRNYSAQILADLADAGMGVA